MFAGHLVGPYNRKHLFFTKAAAVEPFKKIGRVMAPDRTRSLAAFAFRGTRHVSAPNDKSLHVWSDKPRAECACAGSRSLHAARLTLAPCLQMRYLLIEFYAHSFCFELQDKFHTFELMGAAKIEHIHSSTQPHAHHRPT